MATPLTQASLQTALYNQHVALKARIVDFAGWQMPLQYEGQLIEHRAVRTDVGMFDVSHMGQVRFRGARALPFLQHLLPGDFSTLQDGDSKYTQLLQHDGGTIDDLIVTRLSAHEFFAVVNAGTRLNDVAVINGRAQELGYEDVEIIDESESWAMIAVQGPTALRRLDDIIPGRNWSNTRSFTLHAFEHTGRPHLLSRTGYTGEAGAELICPALLGEFWWEAFLRAGIKPCGLAARDSLRLEAGYCLYGNDLTTSTTPVEAGLSWSIGWNKKEDYVGRAVLEEQKRNGPRKRLLGLRIEGRKPLRHGDKIVVGDTVVGEVTSGGYSPGLECGIALAYVDSAQTRASDLAVQTRSGNLPAQIVKPPFVKTSLKP